jgi:hypothetical protein
MNKNKHKKKEIRNMNEMNILKKNKTINNRIN